MKQIDNYIYKNLLNNIIFDICNLVFSWGKDL